MNKNIIFKLQDEGLGVTEPLETPEAPADDLEVKAEVEEETAEEEETEEAEEAEEKEGEESEESKESEESELEE